MAVLTTIYDVRTTPDDAGMLTVGVLTVVSFGLMAFFVYSNERARHPTISSGIFASFSNYDAWLAPGLIAVIVASYLAYRFAELANWQYDFRQGTT